MGYRIFLAGATGAIGRRLIPLLREAGHDVVGMTRSQEKANALLELGAIPVVVDVFDRQALTRIVVAARPDVVIHQLTDLPRGLDPAQMNDAIIRNARIRNEGTGNLVSAAMAAGVRKLVAQSIAWAYAPGALPHPESDPLDAMAEGNRAISVAGVIALENGVLRSPGITGVVLRYGQLYGPGTGADVSSGPIPLHVDAAAYAALLAVSHEISGAFNIVELNEEVATERAGTELGWKADFRLSRAGMAGRPRAKTEPMPFDIICR
jgi:nucleoside-diphosphate-sugar epimerase